MSGQPKRLFRSNTNRVIAGVCGGVGEYFDIDPTVVRILWVLLTLLGGSGLLLYIIALFVIPRNPSMPSSAQPVTVRPPNGTVGRVLGIAFVIVGVLLLLDNLEFFSLHWWWHRTWEFMFPALLILAGIYIISRKKPPQEPSPPGQQQSAPGAEATSPPPHEAPTDQQASGSAGSSFRQLHRSRKDRKLLGVCGGFAEYFDIDPTIVRVLYVLFCFVSFGAGVLIYLVLALVMPEEH